LILPPHFSHTISIEGNDIKSYLYSPIPQYEMNCKLS
jgi:hypothetical protein